MCCIRLEADGLPYVSVSIRRIYGVFETEKVEADGEGLRGLGYLDGHYERHVSILTEFVDLD